MAILFGIVGWQALGWLRADHSFAAEVRVIGAWVQLLAAFGIAGVMLAHGWFTPRRANQR